MCIAYDYIFITYGGIYIANDCIYFAYACIYIIHYTLVINLPCSDVLTRSLKTYTITRGERREEKLNKHCHYRGTLHGNHSCTVLLSKCYNFYRYVISLYLCTAVES